MKKNLFFLVVFLLVQHIVAQDNFSIPQTVQSINNFVSVHQLNWSLGKTIITFQLDSSDGEISKENKISQEDIINNTEKDILLYPNPIENDLHILFGQSFSKRDFTIEISDISGKKILNRKFKEKQQVCSLDLQFLPTGTYFLSVTNNEISKKTIIIKN